MLLLLSLLTGVWVWANLTFASWRVCRLSRKTGQRVDPLKDWAIQLFFRATAFVCLILAVVLAN